MRGPDLPRRQRPAFSRLALGRWYSAALAARWRATVIVGIRPRRGPPESRDASTARRLTRLRRRVHLVEAEHFTLPRGVHLPEKDLPILLAAIDGGATHLLTGDWEHFGPYFRQEIGGVLILPPAEYPPLTA